MECKRVGKRIGDEKEGKRCCCCCCCCCSGASVVSDSCATHRRQPTRLPGPWDPPGKNTGVGCHFLLQCMKVKRESEKWKWSCSVVSDSSRPHGLQPTRILHPWDFPGKSTGVGCHCLLRSLCLYIIKSCLETFQQDFTLMI